MVFQSVPDQHCPLLRANPPIQQPLTESVSQLVRHGLNACQSRNFISTRSPVRVVILPFRPREIHYPVTHLGQNACAEGTCKRPPGNPGGLDNSGFWCRRRDLNPYVFRHTPLNWTRMKNTHKTTLNPCQARPSAI